MRDRHDRRCHRPASRHGTATSNRRSSLAEQSCADIKAPVFVGFEGCHHFVAMNRPELFLRELLARVRPVL